MRCHGCGTEWFSAAATVYVEEGDCPRCRGELAAGGALRNPSASTSMEGRPPRLAEIFADAYEDASGAPGLPTPPAWLRTIHPAL